MGRWVLFGVGMASVCRRERAVWLAAVWIGRGEALVIGLGLGWVRALRLSWSCRRDSSCRLEHAVAWLYTCGVRGVGRKF
eukprot:4890247-Prymnesium_polylepis.1